MSGRVVVVTGGGGGIGRAIARAMAGAGDVIAVLDSNVTGAEATVAEIAEAGGAGLAVCCDIADPADVAAAAEGVQSSLGDVHVLVNNAAIRRPGAIEDLPLEDWNALLAVNLTGYFLCSQAFGRPMLARGRGTLVHVASQASVFAHPGSGAYGVAKAGVALFSRLLALEWGPRGVRSNAVMPGFVNTGQPIYDRADITARRTDAVPVRRIGQPDDIARAVMFLASEEASYVNGSELMVDGGLTRNLMGLVPGPNNVGGK